VSWPSWFWSSFSNWVLACVISASERTPFDQALFFDTTDGLVVLLGCGHAGVVNTLDYIRHVTGARPIHSVLGGMHLQSASPERMEKTIAALRRLDIRRLAPAHCTGLPALAQLWTALPDRCSSCAVGTSMSFQRRASSSP
jgi:7,8-dihydropterin-6-yl-methyl-4-(beta-D-ribofuranosyl)aminobenzene 5'-phosphate synthase